MDMQLFVDMLHVEADGVEADVQFGGSRFVGVALHLEFQRDARFMRRQLVVPDGRAGGSAETRQSRGTAAPTFRQRLPLYFVSSNDELFLAHHDCGA